MELDEEPPPPPFGFVTNTGSVDIDTDDFLPQDDDDDDAIAGFSRFGLRLHTPEREALDELREYKALCDRLLPGLRTQSHLYTLVLGCETTFSVTLSEYAEVIGGATFRFVRAADQPILVLEILILAVDQRASVCGRGYGTRIINYLKALAVAMAMSMGRVAVVLTQSDAPSAGAVGPSDAARQFWARQRLRATPQATVLLKALHEWDPKNEVYNHAIPMMAWLLPGVAALRCDVRGSRRAQEQATRREAEHFRATRHTLRVSIKLAGAMTLLPPIEIEPQIQSEIKPEDAGAATPAPSLPAVSPLQQAGSRKRARGASAPEELAAAAAATTCSARNKPDKQARALVQSVARVVAARWPARCPRGGPRGGGHAAATRHPRADRVPVRRPQVLECRVCCAVFDLASLGTRDSDLADAAARKHEAAAASFAELGPRVALQADVVHSPLTCPTCCVLISRGGAEKGADAAGMFRGGRGVSGARREPSPTPRAAQPRPRALPLARLPTRTRAPAATLAGSCDESIAALATISSHYRSRVNVIRATLERYAAVKVRLSGRGHWTVDRSSMSAPAPASTSAVRRVSSASSVRRDEPRRGAAEHASMPPRGHDAAGGRGTLRVNLPPSADTSAAHRQQGPTSPLAKAMAQLSATAAGVAANATARSPKPRPKAQAAAAEAGDGASDVRKVLKHHVYGGARAGSLFNVYGAPSREPSNSRAARPRGARSAAPAPTGAGVVVWGERLTVRRLPHDCPRAQCASSTRTARAHAASSQRHRSRAATRLPPMCRPAQGRR